MTKAILFDIGGVILEEDELDKEFLNATENILKQSGITFTKEEFDKTINQWVLSFKASSFFMSFIQHLIKDDMKK